MIDGDPVDVAFGMAIGALMLALSTVAAFAVVRRRLRDRKRAWMETWQRELDGDAPGFPVELTQKSSPPDARTDATGGTSEP